MKKDLREKDDAVSPVKNIKTFQSHCMYPPSDQTSSVMNFLMVATDSG